jgi:hypothetical protein
MRLCNLLLLCACLVLFYVEQSSARPGQSSSRPKIKTGVDKDSIWNVEPHQYATRLETTERDLHESQAEFAELKKKKDERGGTFTTDEKLEYVQKEKDVGDLKRNQKALKMSLQKHTRSGSAGSSSSSQNRS